MKINYNSICLLVTFLFIFPFLTYAQIISKEPKDLFISGNESISFTSEINNKDYKLFVKLPRNYGVDKNKKYPVFYALDGHKIFGMATTIASDISYDGYMPEIILIGISYGDDASNFSSLRRSDLTPTSLDKFPNSSGGAPKFIKVISDEIIPLIDKRYRTDKTNRALAGNSHAGLFTHYVLFTEPTLFNSYLISNPSFQWDYNYAFKLENNFAEINSSINAKVLLVSGEFDNVSALTKMFNQIKTHNYKNLILDSIILKDMGHSGTKAEAFSRGFNFIYKRPTIKLPETELLKYTGVYETSRGQSVRIIQKNGELMFIRGNDENGTIIHALDNSNFTFNGKHFDFHFNKDKTGKITGFFFQYNPYNSITAVKINN